MDSLTPVSTVDLFPGLHAELIALLRGLDEQAWLRSTVAGGWRVRDVAAHLLDGDLRKLAAGRDRHLLADRTPSSYAEVVDLIDELNATGVRWGGRLSTRLLTDLLDVTGRWVAEYLAALPPHGEAVFPVAWAGEGRSENWMDIGREYTERWHHQMQIRDAVGAPLLLERRWLHPLLEISVRAFPRAYRGVTAGEGTSVVFDVDGEGDNAWSVVRRGGGWVVVRGRTADAAASLRVDADTAWRLLYNALSPEAVRARASVRGDAALVAPMLAARSVMV